MTGRIEPARIEQVKADHGLAASEAETKWWESVGLHHYGTSATQGFRAGWWGAVGWLLNAQMGLDDLTVGELLAEIRKGPGSIYWPVKHADPFFHADCPRCGRRVLIDAEGLCPDCAHEFEED